MYTNVPGFTSMVPKVFFLAFYLHVIFHVTSRSVMKVYRGKRVQGNKRRGKYPSAIRPACARL